MFNNYLSTKQKKGLEQVDVLISTKYCKSPEYRVSPYLVLMVSNQFQCIYENLT